MTALHNFLVCPECGYGWPQSDGRTCALCGAEGEQSDGTA